MDRKGAGLYLMFQSTLPRRERRQNRRLPVSPLRFQSTLPRRERPNPKVRMMQDAQFQSTLPRRERQPGVLKFAVNGEFQSTLPRRERRWQGYLIGRYTSFNPRSHVGSDIYSVLSISPDSRFNPRSHVGSDPGTQRPQDD